MGLRHPVRLSSYFLCRVLVCSSSCLLMLACALSFLSRARLSLADTCDMSVICHTYVTHMSKTESRAREERVTWHTFMSHVLQNNESCHTQQPVMSPILARLSRARERIGSEHASTSKSQQQNERESEREVLRTVLYHHAPIHIWQDSWTLEGSLEQKTSKKVRRKSYTQKTREKS